MTELGQRLKTARMDKELSYEELQDMTKIQKRYLKAIEEGNYSVLPGAFYARAFIKNYAEAVDLDPDQLFEEYSSDLPVTNERTDFAPRSSKPRSNVPKENKFAKVFPLLLTIALLAALIVGLYWVITNNSKDAGSEPNKDNVDNYQSSAGDEQPDDEKPAGEDEKDTTGDKSGEGDSETKSEPEKEKPEMKLEKLSTQGNTTTYSITNTDEFKIQLKTTGKVYIDVKAGGKMLQPGSKTFDGGKTLDYTLTDQKEVTFNIGATQNIKMTINGKDFSVPIKPAEKPHQKFVFQFEKGTGSSQ